MSLSGNVLAGLRREVPTVPQIFSSARHANLPKQNGRRLSQGALPGAPYRSPLPDRVNLVIRVHRSCLD